MYVCVTGVRVLALSVEQHPAGAALQREGGHGVGQTPPAGVAQQQGEGAEQQAAHVVDDDVSTAQELWLGGKGSKCTSTVML